MSQPRSIDYFNSGHLLRRPATLVSMRARNDQWEVLQAHFGPLLQPGFRVLDLGTTPDESLVDSNFFAKKLVEAGVDLTMSSPEDCASVAAKLGARFVDVDRLQAEVREGEYDLVVSAAVFEHVGSDAAQRAFAGLVRRCGTYFFVTTPNRWFPVEFHTFLPLLHWLPKPVHRWILRHVFRERFWSLEENLNLQGRDEVLRAFSAGTGDTVHVATRLLGLPCNHVVIRSPRTVTSSTETATASARPGASNPTEDGA
jgi:2-polyprenyl-3-methyl-5-hydroxy-6-metoxy-1,4-benzoquinol methylase